MLGVDCDNREYMKWNHTNAFLCESRRTFNANFFVSSMLTIKSRPISALKYKIAIAIMIMVIEQQILQKVLSGLI